MIGALSFRSFSSSSNDSTSITSSLETLTSSWISAIKLYFSNSDSISESVRGESMPFMTPIPIKSATISVASFSIKSAILLGEEFWNTSTIFTSSSSSSSVGWVTSSSSSLDSNSSTEVSGVSSITSSGWKANFTNSSSSSVNPLEAVLTSKPNSLAWNKTSAEATSNSLAIWWIRFFAIYSSSLDGLSSSWTTSSSCGESPSPSISIL